MSRNDKISRRQFIKTSAAGAAAVSLATVSSCSKEAKVPGPAMPTRTLGKTGLEVSMLTFGGGSQFLKNPDGQWEPMLERAVELGINLFDTSSTYQWGASLSSEERFGEVLSKYRNRILLSTKFENPERDVDKCMQEIERSLKRLKTDHLDILLVHSIEKTEDIGALEKGMYKKMVSLKEQGITRFIGFSSMNSADKSKELIEKLDIDVALMAMNPTGYGDFVSKALPAAREKNLGIMAMKLMRDLVTREGTTPKELLYYALNLPGVATAAVGHHGIEKLEENVRLTRAFGQEANAMIDMRALEKRLAGFGGPDHLCWARADYYDGMMC